MNVLNPSPELAARLAPWLDFHEHQTEWTGEMLMAISEVCAQLSDELSTVLGVPIHVSFDPVLLPIVERRTPDEWAKVTGIIVADPDGWRPPYNDDRTWETPISRDEYIARALRSTTEAWPTPALDEQPAP